MAISLQPPVQWKGLTVLGGLCVLRQAGEGRERCKLCLSGIHFSPLYSYIWCIAFELAPGEVAATCLLVSVHLYSNSVVLRQPGKPGHKRLILPCTQPERYVARRGDGAADSQPAAWWNTTCNRGCHGDLGERAPFACCLWSQDFCGALGENVPFPLVWDLTRCDWSFPWVFESDTRKKNRLQYPLRW